MIERYYVDEADVIEKYKNKPGAANKVFDNSPRIPSGNVFGCSVNDRAFG